MFTNYATTNKDSRTINHNLLDDTAVKVFHIVTAYPHGNTALFGEPRNSLPRVVCVVPLERSTFYGDNTTASMRVGILDNGKLRKTHNGKPLWLHVDAKGDSLVELHSTNNRRTRQRGTPVVQLSVDAEAAEEAALVYDYGKATHRKLAADRALKDARENADTLGDEHVAAWRKLEAHRKSRQS